MTEYMFEVSPDFKIGCDHNKHIHEENIDKFWVEAKDYADKQGCYVFAVRASKGFTPWYVGKTKNSFKGECFTADKLIKYLNALNLEGEKLHGTPVMFFIAPPGRRNVVRKEFVSELEMFLIQSAKSTNPKLINKQRVKLPRWGIKGVTRSGKGASSLEARSFSKMMDL